MTIPPVDPRHTALMVMDYQPTILSPYSNATDLVQRTAGAIAEARSVGVKIIYVRVAFTAQDYAAITVRNKRFAPLTRGGMLVDGTPEADIHPDLKPADGDIIVRKTRVGSFSTTNLANLLNGHAIDTLILAGMSTSGVTLSTLRDAADHDYRLLVLRDCCDDPDPEVQRALMEVVFPTQADVIDSTTLSKVLGISDC
jgi:nicotinamidase-related amidase